MSITAKILLSALLVGASVPAFAQGNTLAGSAPASNVPASTTQPLAGAQKVATAKPAELKKPDTTVNLKPAAAQHATTTQPAAGAKPTAAAQSSVSPSTAAKPIAAQSTATQSTAAVKPATSAAAPVVKSN
jgi:hypothetical protein